VDKKTVFALVSASTEARNQIVVFMVRNDDALDVTTFNAPPQWTTLMQDVTERYPDFFQVMLRSGQLTGASAADMARAGDALIDLERGIIAYNRIYVIEQCPRPHDRSLWVPVNTLAGDSNAQEMYVMSFDTNRNYRRGLYVDVLPEDLALDRCAATFAHPSQLNVTFASIDECGQETGLPDMWLPTESTPEMPGGTWRTMCGSKIRDSTSVQFLDVIDISTGYLFVLAGILLASHTESGAPAIFYGNRDTEYVLCEIKIEGTMRFLLLDCDRSVSPPRVFVFKIRRFRKKHTLDTGYRGLVFTPMGTMDRLDGRIGGKDIVCFRDEIFRNMDY
jgi:hypothetical protein